MKIFITGAGGFLGKKIVKSLLEAGSYDLKLGIRQSKSEGPLQAILAGYPQANATIENVNLMNKEQLKSALAGRDMIIHTAAGMKGSPADMYMNTVVATRNLLDAAVEAGVKRIVMISSFAVYNTNDLASNAMVDESTPIEGLGVTKGVYAYTKVQQEQIFLEYRQKHGIEGVILRPGVIFGPGGGGLSSRVGIGAFGFFGSFGGSALLPLTYIDNCADAVVAATINFKPDAVYNVVDDNIPTCREFLSLYRKRVEKMKVIPVPYAVLMKFSGFVERYFIKSKGQLPAVLTPYIVRSMFRPFKYSNQGLKNIGWSPKVSMSEGLNVALVPKN